MGSNRYEKVDAEGRALHESWDDVARVALLVAGLATVVWAVCAGLRYAVHHATDALFHFVTGDPVWGGAALIAALVTGGLVRGFLIRRPGWDRAAGDGMAVALDNYHVTYEHEEDDPQPRYERPAFELAAKKAVATLVTLGTGGSGGLEAPVVLVSESIGAGWARVMRTRSEHELRTYQLAAIGAGVATLLGAPFTAALFAIEIAYADRIIYRKFAYALFAAMVAYILNNHLVGSEPLFTAPPHDRTYQPMEYAAVAVVSVLVSAPIALGFAWVLGRARGLVESVHPYLHGVAGALGTGLVALALWWTVGMEPVHVLGMGEHTLVELLAHPGEGQLGAWWFLLLAVLGRMLTTGLTIQSGGSAGMLIPSMFFGGVSGAAVAELLALTPTFAGLDTSIFVVAGIASALVAVVGVPLAAIALVLEVFGPAYGPPAILACGVTYVLSLRFTVYRQQRRSPSPTGDETGSEDASEAA